MHVSRDVCFKGNNLSTQVLYLYGLNLVQRWRVRAFGGPKPDWLFGSLRVLRKQIQPEAYAAWRQRHGAIFRVFLGRQPVIVVSGVGGSARRPVHVPLLLLVSIACSLWKRQPGARAPRPGRSAAFGDFNICVLLLQMWGPPGRWACAILLHFTIARRFLAGPPQVLQDSAVHILSGKFNFKLRVSSLVIVHR